MPNEPYQWAIRFRATGADAQVIGWSEWCEPYNGTLTDEHRRLAYEVVLRARDEIRQLLAPEIKPR